jgi:SHR-binding domain of vacuolar-sorting associated protein 13
MNLTGILLKDLAEMKFDLLRDKKPRQSGELKDRSYLSPNALSTVGLRSATETRSIKVRNCTGCDILVTRSGSRIEADQVLVSNGAILTVCEGQDLDSVSLNLQLAPQSLHLLGEREPVSDIPVKSHSGHGVIYLLRPVATFESMNPGMANLLRLIEGRASPETILTDSTNLDLLAYHNAEPVVEWCMHNERLRSSTVDVFSLPKGRDLLSNCVWSPEDEDGEGFTGMHSPTGDHGPEAAAGDAYLRSLSPTGSRQPTRAQGNKYGNWLKPYLKDDSPEWTDMTCTLRMARERVMLPDSNWIWVNDWVVDLSGKLGDATDADGWEYEADFETFTRRRRGYRRGDSCRRRRWTRTRIVKPPRLDDPLRQLKFVWESSKDDNGNYSVVVRSHVRVSNSSGSTLSFFVFSPSWDDDVFIGTANAGEVVCVPIHLASAVYMRLARRVGKSESPKVRDCLASERFLILPSSNTSSHYTRISMDLQDVSSTTLHFLVEVRSSHGIIDINIEPVLRVVNLLPCVLECQLGEVLVCGDSRAADGRPIVGQRSNKRIAQCEAVTVSSGKEGTCTAVSPWRKPHISLRVPGYTWSPWQRITNRKANSDTWRPPDSEEEWHFSCKGDTDVAEEWKTIVRFKRAGSGGDPLSVILSIECGHCPTLRVYSQYWIVDKTGFGCRFAEGFSDMLGSTPDLDTSRKSYLPPSEAKEHDIKRDLSLPGHQWSIGMSGMSLFFSTREQITLAVDAGVRDRRTNKSSQKIKSNWTSPLDISNVFPKTVISIDEFNGPRRFELAICLTVCPGMFSRTKLITLLPRYQIVNLLHRELVVAQDGCLDAVTRIPSQSAVAFHWERSAFAPKVRIGAPSVKERDSGAYANWTNGRFRVDRVGITSIRLPTDTGDSRIPLVVQAEVRLASKDQSSAVVVVVWAANQNSNPLYILRNRTPFTILCRQPLRNETEIPAPDSAKSDILSISHCTGQSGSNACDATDIGPIVSSLLGLNKVEEFVWVLKGNDIACFGFDDPEKPHVIEWTCVRKGEPKFQNRKEKSYVEVDAMGSSSVLTLPGTEPLQICCRIGAEHSTKVIEFTEFSSQLQRTKWDPLQTHRVQWTFENPLGDDEEDPAFSVRVELPGVFFSVVDNVDPESYGREILLTSLEKISGTFSQTREGYHEFEFKLMSMQVDNHVHKSIHPVLVSERKWTLPDRVRRL